jgi:tetraacyldisaccharide 4'-kinase
LRQAVLKFWYRKSVAAYLLAPLSWIFQLICGARYYFYRYLKAQRTFPVPVIVVGNLTVGGTGKTPLVSWIINMLKEQGYHPGIVMRGYGSSLKNDAFEIVAMQSLAVAVGDEPLMLRQKTDCPLVIGKNRPEAVKALLKAFPEVNIVISDDGLQHYALSRDIEIAVIDGKLRLGNGFCLPVGPLRESKQRLKSVDFVVANGNAMPGEWVMGTQLGPMAHRVNNNDITQVIEAWQGQTVHAVAGVGNPERFFSALRAKGMNVIAHPFPDHYVFKNEDIAFNDDLIVVMTEKDAVKCRTFASNRVFCIPLEVKLQDEFKELLLRKIQSGQKVA